MTQGQNSSAGTAVGPVLSEAAIKWCDENRRLSEATLAALNVADGTVWFPDANAKKPAVFFKYADGWKARAYPEKHFVSNKGFKLSFWNLERVIAAKSDEVFIVEGELDACALVEAGVPPEKVLSVPNGAKERPASEPADQRGYGYVKEALDAGLNKVKRFIWCGDSDDAGRSLRSDMVRILGAARFWFVEWPEGCKDANDFLIKDGAHSLCDLVVNGQLPWPVNGIFRLKELPEPPALTLWNPGFPEWERKVFLAPRTLSVVTGQPGHGKTQLFQQIWFQVSRAYSIPVCMASFETRPKPHLRRQIRTLLSGKPESDMSENEKHSADEWIENHYLFLEHPERRPTLRWFLDCAEVAVIRYGARVVQLDPWNRLEGSREREETETEYIGRCLRELHGFAHDLNCHVQIIAHPAKMDGNRRGKPPTLEDISASKHWENMVDQGFVVYRPEVFDGVNRKTEAQLLHKKARFDELGYPCQLNLDFDLTKYRYRSTDYETGVYSA